MFGWFGPREVWSDDVVLPRVCSDGSLFGPDYDRPVSDAELAAAFRAATRPVEPGEFVDCDVDVRGGFWDGPKFV